METHYRYGTVAPEECLTDYGREICYYVIERKLDNCRGWERCRIHVMMKSLEGGKGVVPSELSLRQPETSIGANSNVGIPQLEDIN